MTKDAVADPGPELDGSGDHDPDAQYTEALILGLKRARVHLVRAGIELVSGLGVVIEELKRVRDEEDDATHGKSRGPTRIELE